MEYGNLKLALYESNITIETVAEFLGIHRNSVTNKLNGTSSFTIAEAQKLKKGLLTKYDSEYLFKLTEKKKSEKEILEK